ncbi:universal stress protein [Actinoplanes oblitus]|uniref:Universal stress protein n=1 Tax=Actinoplanes oblitus TaxID=3040509 RepID=A0ABY8WT34_9ACTN|nr:universal stress protein [Actinoplanes oblitus]WIN00608.1 universal stress protein [Actinoplanes oblitus]
MVAAVDDDDNAAVVLSYAATRAREFGVPLRAVHVWGRAGERIPDADLLLTCLLYDCLPEAEASAAEREILHDDPVPALAALSREALLLVVSASSAAVTADRPLGDTAHGLAGRTACPLVVVAPRQRRR